MTQQNETSTTGDGDPFINVENPPRVSTDEIKQHIAGVADDKHIAIWGMTQSGKTVYLAMLYHVLREHKRYQLRIQNNESQQWLENISLQKLQKGAFPRATQIGTYQFLPFIVEDRQTEEIIAKVTFIDGPGEMFSNSTEYQKTHSLPFDIIEYFHDCRGLICLLDPIQVIKVSGGQAALAEISRTIHKIALKTPDSTVRKPIAMCITKCDDPILRQNQDHFIDPFTQKDAFVKANFNNITLELKNYKAKLEWFASSAIGLDNGRQNLFVRWNGELGIRRPDKLAPINIAEPFVWLLDEVLQSKGV